MSQEKSPGIRGHRFVATLQLRMPLRVLRLHGVCVPLGQALPDCARDLSEGIWVLQTVTFRELGIDIDELPAGDMASEIGPVPADGGEFLVFLKVVRLIVEGHEDLLHRRDKLKAFLRSEHWSETCAKLGGRQAIVDRFFPPFLETVKGLPSTAIAALWGAGLTTPAAISQTADSRLAQVPGLGKARIAALRAACEDAADPASEFIDLVER